MDKYIGVKIIHAEKAIRKGGKVYAHGEAVPRTMDPVEEGYAVTYEDGYTSWSPKDVFEKAYKEVGVVADEKEERVILVNPSTGNWHVVGSVATMEAPKRTNASEFFPFGTAIEELKVGKKVARVGWNGKGMWLVLVEPRSKDGELVSKTWNFIYEVAKADLADLLPWIGMKTADEKFVPWLASQTDMLAEDWQIVE